MIKGKRQVEIFKGRSLTETRGFVPFRKQVEALLAAGTTLMEAKARLMSESRRFDAMTDEDVRKIDMRFVAARQPGFDLADYSELQRVQAQRLADVRERVRLRKAKAAEAAASAESSEPVPETPARVSSPRKGPGPAPKASAETTASAPQE